MFYSSKALTVAALAFVITSALGQVTCFAPDPDPTLGLGDCSSFITTFCASIAGELIAPGDAAARCFPGPPSSTANLSCDFTAINKGTVAGNFAVDTCEDFLTTVNAQCGLVGGVGQPSGQEFQYFIDPNTRPDICAPVDCSANPGDDF
ncbi:hypothetical protein B0H14DRAFT_3163575 [Mycena olivaceomarginata]|nr:hypothetical protein B0H14DRAFT_3163575 [Mycena olivaceomarginata]